MIIDKERREHRRGTEAVYGPGWMEAGGRGTRAEAGDRVFQVAEEGCLVPVCQLTAISPASQPAQPSTSTRLTRSLSRLQAQPAWAACLLFL